MTDSTPSPVEAFLGWYRDAPPEICDHLAFFFGGLAPGDTLAGSHSLEPLTSEEMCERISTLAAAASAVRAVGMALMLRTFVDFTLKGRATTEDWQAARESNLLIADIAESQGSESLPGKLRERAETFPLKGRQWIREADRWAQLKQSALSDQSIDEWLKAALRPR